MLAYKYLFREKNSKAAIVEFSKAIRLGPNSAKMYCGRAIAHLSNGNVRSALGDLSFAINLDPALPLIYNVRANVFKAIGNEAQAQNDYATCVKLYQDNEYIETVIRPRTETGYPVGLIIPTSPRLLSNFWF